MNKQSEKLAKAIAYEAKKKKERDEDKRPAFHVNADNRLVQRSERIFPIW